MLASRLSGRALHNAFTSPHAHSCCTPYLLSHAASKPINLIQTSQRVVNVCVTVKGAPAPEPEQPEQPDSLQEGPAIAQEEEEMRLPSGPASPVIGAARFAALNARAQQRLWLSVPKALLKLGSKGMNASHYQSLKVINVSLAFCLGLSSGGGGFAVPAVAASREERLVAAMPETCLTGVLVLTPLAGFAWTARPGQGAVQQRTH